MMVTMIKLWATDMMVTMIKLCAKALAQMLLIFQNPPVADACPTK